MAKLSESAKFYRANKKARDAKKAYDTKFHSTKERKRYRATLNRARRKRNLRGDSRDLSHQKNDSLVLENKSTNRGRQGANGKSTKK